MTIQEVIDVATTGKKKVLDPEKREVHIESLGYRTRLVTVSYPDKTFRVFLAEDLTLKEE